ncbi:MAG: radical SAM protein [Planctomycetes bacterium]|nr:radical SAM protein [Planctomycetota bacterium]
MPKLNLCIINKCNRNCEFCFEEEFKRGPEQRMGVADVERICRFANVPKVPGQAVCVLGGEPTLHPELSDIIARIRGMNATANIQLLTNLLCDASVLESLAEYRPNCLVNIGGFGSYSPEEQKQVRDNLALLRKREIFQWIWLAVTLWDERQDFGFLYDILEQDQPRSIGALRIAIANPGQGFANQFPRERCLGIGDKYLEIVETCHKIRPLFSFVNECFVNLCMMSEEVYAKLEGVVMNLSRYCTGTFDILPDFSTHWCFAFRGIPEMCVENIFDHRDMDKVHAILRAKAADMEADLDRQCDTTRCTSLKCVGPCPAVKYYRKYRQSPS